MSRAVLAALLSAGALLACREPVPAPAEVPWPPSLEGFDGELVRALEQAADEVREAPRDAAAWIRLGMTYEAHVMLEYAADCYASAVQLDGDDPKAWYRLAVMRVREGQVDGALAAFARVHDLAAGYAPAHRRRGRFLVDIGRPDEARAAFDAALALDPGDVSSQLGLVQVALDTGHPEQALTRLDGLTRVPRASQGLAHRLRGLALSRLGRNEEAEPELALGRGARAGGADPWLREVAKLKVGQSAVLLRADRLIDGGQPDAALGLLRGLEQTSPDDPRVFRRLGKAHARLGQWPEAAGALTTAAELDPSDAGLRLAVASARLEAGDATGALEATEDVLAIDPTAEDAHLLRAHLLLGAGRIDEAADACAEARAQGVESATLEVVAGKAELERERFAASLACFERATGLDATTPDAWAGTTLAHLRLGDTGAAETALARLCSLAPQHPLRTALEAGLAEAKNR